MIHAEGDMTRTATGMIVGEGVRIGELTGLGVDLEDGDVVGSEIADQNKAIVG